MICLYVWEIFLFQIVNITCLAYTNQLEYELFLTQYSFQLHYLNYKFFYSLSIHKSADTWNPGNVLYKRYR